MTDADDRCPCGFDDNDCNPYGSDCLYGGPELPPGISHFEVRRGPSWLGGSPSGSKIDPLPRELMASAFKAAEAAAAFNASGIDRAVERKMLQLPAPYTDGSNRHARRRDAARRRKGGG